MMGLALVFIVGCGDRSGLGEAHFRNAETLVDVTQCIDATPEAKDVADYITVDKGDTIIKKSTDAQLGVFHDIYGVKKVCMIKGEVTVRRAQEGS